MRVIGIDPGTRHLGWGVVDVVGPRVTHVAHGVIHTVEGSPLADRLVVIDDELRGIVQAHAPLEAAVESIFFSKDAQAAAKLGHARGVVLLHLCRAGLTVAEYAPAHVKRAIVGGGRADKHQVAMVIKALLRLATPPPSDAADALAIAITHGRTTRLPALLEARRPGASDATLRLTPRARS